MSVPYPSPAQIKEAATEVGLSLTDADIESYSGLMKGMVDAYNLVDHMPDYLPEVKYPRTPGYFPSAEENARIRVALDCIGAGAMVIGVDGRIDFVNEYARHLFAQRASDFRQVIAGFDPGAVVAAIEPACRDVAK